MKQPSILATATILAFAMPAYGEADLAGQYAGKIIEAIGYPGNAGEPCQARIETLNLDGGSYSFSLNGEASLTFGIAQVKQAMTPNGDKIKLDSKVGLGIEKLFMKLRPDGSPAFLRLERKSHGAAQTLACGELVKR
jgi:hypothetical protein